jgi:dipeptidyl aminopeptidase/acylaminoacyl peptidase
VGQRIRIVDALSGAALVEFDKRGKLQDVRWSPDGAHLAIVAGADINDPAPRRLLVAPAAGGPFRALFPDLEGDIDHVQWMAADALVYVGSRGVKSVVGWTNLEGSDQRLLCELGDVSLGAFHVSKDGMSASFTADTPDRPAEVYTMDATDTAPARLTDHNPWLSDRRFASQEIISYAARDGLALEGILIRPLGAEPDTRYPLILVVHGGPEAHYSNGWLSGYSTLGQVAAGRGFAVFYPNYRGSTGRGLAFAKLSQGDPAGKEFDDLVDGVQHLVKIGLVDEKRVGVTGGSYGGYATAWCATRYSEHFAAGVMFVGISDKVSKWGTTDIPEEDYNVHTLKRVWEDWDFMLERSPIFHSASARTPLLILHGKDDPRVDPGQSRELYRHLKVRGQAPVRLVYYPGEGHGNRKAASRLDYSLRSLGWMEHYLKGPGGEPPAYALDYSDPRKAAQAEEAEETSAVGE